MKNHHVRCWDCLSLLNWTGAITLSLLPKLPPKKFGALVWSMKCLPHEVVFCLFVSVNLPYGLAWNTLFKYSAILCQQNLNSLMYDLNGFKSRINWHV